LCKLSGHCSKQLVVVDRQLPQSRQATELTRHCRIEPSAVEKGSLESCQSSNLGDQPPRAETVAQSEKSERRENADRCRESAAAANAVCDVESDDLLCGAHKPPSVWARLSRVETGTTNVVHAVGGTPDALECVVLRLLELCLSSTKNQNDECNQF
jgi:hypothetical protein